MYNYIYENESAIDLKVQIVTLNEKSKNVLIQYIKFSKKVDNCREKIENKKLTLEDLIDECIAKYILKEYLSEHKKGK